MQRRYAKIALIVVVVFLVFSPSIFSELCTVDDVDAYKRIATRDFSLVKLFFPNTSGAGYYRPMIGLSYFFDKYVWLLDTRLMHLDNIFFHIFNALIVYWLAVLLRKEKFSDCGIVPVFSSLLFALHPIVTESVAWISGRTDVFACTFVLLCTVSLLKYKDTRERRYLLIALLLLLPGLLAKETSIAFLVGGAFILNAREFTQDNLTVRHSRDFAIVVIAAVLAIVLLLITYNVWAVFLVALGYVSFTSIQELRLKKYSVKSTFLVPIVVLISVGTFFFIRKLVFVSSLSSIPRTLQLIADDLNYSLQTFLGAAGFYVKKFFLPFPLNFAIREIDPYYNFLGVAVFFLCLYWIKKRSLAPAFFLAGVALFLPALPLSLGTVTWTGYAERYIYISSAFWVLSMALWGTEVFGSYRGRKKVVSVLTLLIVCLGMVSFYRSLLWQSNISLLRDTVKKAPNFKIIREDYMAALMKEGDFKEAKNQYQVIALLPSVGYSEKADLNLALIMTLEGRHNDAAELYEKVIEKTRGASVLAYGAYISFLQGRLSSARLENDSTTVNLVGTRLLTCMRELYEISKDPMILYRSGQLALSLGKCNESRMLFEKASNSFRPEVTYAIFAKKLADNLAQKI